MTPTVRTALDRAGTVGREVNAFLSLRRVAALAEAADGAFPIAVKANIDVAGEVTTAGSRILARRADRDAPVVARLRAAGAVVVGATNMHEFAWGGTSRNPHHGDVLNPHDRTRIAGGSSGGSAAAIAAGVVRAALGTDTAGSARYPAALCGVVGLRPTPGRIPTDGVFPLAPTLDEVGPMGATVDDVHRIYEIAADTVLPTPGSTGVRAGFLASHWTARAQPAVAAALHRVAAALPALREVTAPVDLGEVVAVTRTILLVEAARVHEPWLAQRPHHYGDDVRELLQIGAGMTDAELDAALARRAVIAERMHRFLTEDVDVLVMPTLPFTAPRLGDESVRLGDGAVVDRAAEMLDYGSLASVAGLPALSVPIHAPGELPVGLQVIGAPGAEAVVLEVGRRIEDLRTRS